MTSAFNQIINYICNYIFFKAIKEEAVRDIYVNH